MAKEPSEAPVTHSVPAAAHLVTHRLQYSMLSEWQTAVSGVGGSWGYKAVTILRETL